MLVHTLFLLVSLCLIAVSRSRVSQCTDVKYNWCQASYSPLPTEIGPFQVIFAEGVPFFVFTLSLINLTCTFICRLVDQRVCMKLKKRSKGDMWRPVCVGIIYLM